MLPGIPRRARSRLGDRRLRVAWFEEPVPEVAADIDPPRHPPIRESADVRSGCVEVDLAIDRAGHGSGWKPGARCRADSGGHPQVAEANCRAEFKAPVLDRREAVAAGQEPGVEAAGGSNADWEHHAAPVDVARQRQRIALARCGRVAQRQLVAARHAPVGVDVSAIHRIGKAQVVLEAHRGGVEQRRVQRQIGQEPHVESAGFDDQSTRDVCFTRRLRIGH